LNYEEQGAYFSRLIQALRYNPAHMKRLLLVFLATSWMACAAGVPAVGSPAPEFSLPDQAGRTLRLADYRGKWVVLYFYPKDDTPGCTEEACTFRDDQAALTLLGAQVVGISLDDTASHAAFAKKYSLPFPLLADTDAKVSASYGAVTNLVVAKFARRYTFLIDPQGRIARAYLNVDTSRHSAEIIADLKRLTKP
jgi:thioredoxin-dependent peroxiredoxin